MSKKIFLVALILILLCSLFAIFLSASAQKQTGTNDASSVDSILEGKISIGKDGEIKIIAKRDFELEELVSEFKKKGLKIGLALGGGSARGFAHIGVIQVLQAYGIPIDIIAGTSIGSLVGSLYAAGDSIENMEKAVLLLNKRKMLSLMDFTIPRSGLIRGNKIENMLIDWGLEDKTFDELNIPFAAVATDIESGERVILHQGKVADAVRASISIPGIFIPVKYDDRYLVDGGVVDPVPVDLAKKMGADIVIAVSLAIKIQPTTNKIITFDEKSGNLENTKDSIIAIMNSILKEESISLKEKMNNGSKDEKYPDIVKIITNS
ncbi:patatin-like phospholipase family protein, partial [bacterium]|nr:patatin-like phospholipase family protein [bacterium]